MRISNEEISFELNTSIPFFFKIQLTSITKACMNHYCNRHIIHIKTNTEIASLIT